MAIREIRHLPDEVLRKKASKVTKVDRSIRRLTDDMVETMHAANGVGLAAPQVGISLRVVVLQMPEEEVVTMINPEIIKSREEGEVQEACLSVPGYLGQIRRFASVTVKGLDREGKPFRIKADGLMAQVLQHELDHLDGRLYIDRIEDPENLHRVEAPPTE